mmetsp:Transcript_24361/g.67504  ORF Transcript_24361/g.67504 Transcript_24361/m.67504 type:complete len:469 (-) Transcript_24361:105-1511(-)|eukprot:CAMPEP_0168721608 /NCGR_PEP_ID=MMETSP0724-20121128/2170_1 /TAXON_ID=265536 /ORGANISM="Amphiprora sp., Strain CCMP467" /LENGTH=468 /DNA_ID=CAMNT_0008768255 /DNA_START=98 /DNA_END=1504 /DNA_ORIENTATION=-
MTLHNVLESADDDANKLNRIELFVDSNLDDDVLDEMSLSREIHEAWFSHGVRKFPIHLTCENVSCQFGPSLERATSQELKQNLCGLDLVHAHIVELDVKRLVRVAPNLRELHFCAQTFVGTHDILQTLRNKLNDKSGPSRFDRLAIVRHVAMERKFIQLIADFMSHLLAQDQLNEMELDWCGGPGSSKILVDSVLAQQQIRQQDQMEQSSLKSTAARHTITLCYSGCGDAGSLRCIPDWTRLVEGLHPGVVLKLTLQEIPMLLNHANSCPFSCLSSPISDLLNALHQHPPARFCVGNVGLNAEAIDLLCRGLGQFVKGEFGLWDEGLLEGDCFAKLIECIPQMTVKNLALQDTKQALAWSTEQARRFLAAVESNVTLNNVDYHLGPILGVGTVVDDSASDQQKDRNADMIEKQLQTIFRRNKCIDFVRQKLSAPIPEILFPKVLASFGDEDYSPTLTYIFWLSQIGLF